MIGLDTNVLVRYIVRDDPVHTALAEMLIEQHCSEENPGFVSHIVLCELCWVLTRAYKMPLKKRLSLISPVWKKPSPRS